MTDIHPVPARVPVAVSVVDGCDVPVTMRALAALPGAGYVDGWVLPPGGVGHAGEEVHPVRAPPVRAPQHTLVDARAALREVVPEFVRLVRSIPDPNAAAVGNWRAGDVAAHVSHVCGADTDALAGRELPTVTVSHASVAELTAAMLADDSERDPAVLADCIGTLADE